LRRLIEIIGAIRRGKCGAITVKDDITPSTIADIPITCLSGGLGSDLEDRSRKNEEI
jgi:hypothetical protein